MKCVMLVLSQKSEEKRKVEDDITVYLNYKRSIKMEDTILAP